MVIFAVVLTDNITTIMTENETTEQKPDGLHIRTREEILAWLDRARKRKEQFMKESDEWFAERDRRRKELMESDYYQIEWV